MLQGFDRWPDQYEAAVAEWAHTELGAHALRELLHWHWLAVPSRHDFLGLVSAIRLFGPRAAATFSAEVEPIEEYVNLEAFSLRHCGLKATEVERLLDLVTTEQTLSYLGLRDNDVRATDLGAVERHERLRHLDLRSNDRLWDGGVSPLPPSLETLLVDRTGLDDATFAELAAPYPALETLGLSGNPLGDVGFERFLASAEFPSLRCLYLGESALTSHGMLTLVTTGIAGQLEELVLVGADLSRLGTGVLTRFGALRRAALIDCQLEPDVLDEWLRSPAGEALEWIDVSGE